VCLTRADDSLLTTYYPPHALLALNRTFLIHIFYTSFTLLPCDSQPPTKAYDTFTWPHPPKLYKYTYPPISFPTLPSLHHRPQPQSRPHQHLHLHRHQQPRHQQTPPPSTNTTAINKHHHLHHRHPQTSSSSTSTATATSNTSDTSPRSQITIDLTTAAASSTIIHSLASSQCVSHGLPQQHSDAPPRHANRDHHHGHSNSRPQVPHHQGRPVLCHCRRGLR
jgi:hypothetical protein